MARNIGTVSSLQLVALLLSLFCSSVTDAQLACNLVHTNKEYAVPSTNSCGWEIATCPAGFRCQAGICQEPIACAAGKFTTEGTAACKKCAHGKYAPFASMSECIICPAGTACNKTANNGVFEPEVCAMGYFAPQESSR